MHAPWLGMRRIAFIPVLDSSIDTNPPGDFREQVKRRVWFDPDPSTVWTVPCSARSGAVGPATLGASRCNTVT